MKESDRRQALKAVKTLQRLLKDPDVSERTKLRAAQFILKYAGKDKKDD